MVLWSIVEKIIQHFLHIIKGWLGWMKGWGRCGAFGGEDCTTSSSDDAENTAADTNNSARNTIYILLLTQKAPHRRHIRRLRLRNWCDLHQSAL
jgi:hypothetical protein